MAVSSPSVILTIPTIFLTAFGQQITRKEKREEKKETTQVILCYAVPVIGSPAVTHPHANQHPDCKKLYPEKEGSNGSGLSCESGVQQRGNRQLESGSAQLITTNSNRHTQANPSSGRRLNMKQALLLFSLGYIIGNP